MRSHNRVQIAFAMALGLVLSLCIAFVGGQPEAAWLGFAVAGMYVETPRGRSEVARVARWLRR